MRALSNSVAPTAIASRTPLTFVGADVGPSEAPVEGDALPAPEVRETPQPKQDRVVPPAPQENEKTRPNVPMANHGSSAAPPSLPRREASRLDAADAAGPLDIAGQPVTPAQPDSDAVGNRLANGTVIEQPAQDNDRPIILGAAFLYGLHCSLPHPRRAYAATLANRTQ